MLVPGIAGCFCCLASQPGRNVELAGNEGHGSALISLFSLWIQNAAEAGMHCNDMQAVCYLGGSYTAGVSAGLLQDTPHCKAVLGRHLAIHVTERCQREFMQRTNQSNPGTCSCSGGQPVSCVSVVLKAQNSALLCKDIHSDYPWSGIELSNVICSSFRYVLLPKYTCEQVSD